jgi:signal transduction histidine kinase
MDIAVGRPEVLGRFAIRERHAAVWIGLWIAVAGAEMAALAPLLASDDRLTGVSLVFRLIGGSFAACGLIAWRRRPDSRTGPLMLATGFGLFVQPVFSEVDSPAVRTIGDLLEDAWGITMFALLLTFLTGGRLTTVADRVLVGALVLQLALEWVRHLFLAREGNFLFVHADDGLAAGIARFNLLLTATACIAVAGVIAARWLRASRPRRRAMLPGVAGISCLLLFAAAQGGVPELVRWMAVLSLLTVPAAFLVGLLRSRLARGGLAELFRDLQAGPELQPSLARTLGDPGLVVAYAPLAAGPGRAVAPVAVDGRPVAWLRYDATLDDDPELVEAVCAAAAVAIENEALRDESKLRLAELQASRERIVAAGDAERRRLERDLHDGAQQRLVSLALVLRLAKTGVPADLPGLKADIGNAAEELTEVVDDLRELARGIHPSVLVEGGLGPALQTLTRRSVVPVDLTVGTRSRYATALEVATYYVVSEALTNAAKHARASRAVVSLEERDDALRLTVRDDGAGGAEAGGGSGLVGLRDRVESLGGSILVVSPVGHGTAIHVSLPLNRNGEQDLSTAGADV